MAELGIDMSAEIPKVLTTEAVKESDVVITMGCGDECPVLPRQALRGLGPGRPRRPGRRGRPPDPRRDQDPHRGPDRFPHPGRQVAEHHLSREHRGHKEQLIIIGSGPAGYTAAIYAARAGLSPLVLAGSVTAGGALMNTTEVENFPGFPAGIQGPELMDGLQEQAERFGAKIAFDDVTEVQLYGHLKRVVTGAGDTHEAPAVILATGSAYKELGLPEEKRLSGHGVSWCATCDGFFFREQDIIVVGGGDSAMEEAMFLTRFAKTVTVVVRKDELRASRIMAQRAKDNPKIRFAWNSAITAIHGDTKVTGVTLEDTRSGESREHAATGIFVAIGHVPRTELVPDRWSSTPRATSRSTPPPRYQPLRRLRLR